MSSIAAIVIFAVFGLSRAAASQPASRGGESRWTFGATVGGFLRGNKDAVTDWLRQNKYGAAEPQRCTFDILFQKTCVTGDDYPRVSRRSLVTQMASVGLRVGERVIIETTVAGEQSGAAMGHCDNTAVPKDARCTERFVDVEFSGISVATVAVLELRRLHVGLGPAFLLADWRMTPAELPGLWLDATYQVRSWPVFARMQYRYYRSTSFDRSTGFSRFHPSTLFVGAGFVTTTNNNSR